MRIIQRLNPGPGIADFWSEFKRPNPYRWPILAGSALLTGSLMYLLTDHAVSLNWLAGIALAVIGGVALVAIVAARIRLSLPALLLAGSISALTIWQFAKFEVIVPPRPPVVEYISTFAPGRSDAEIAASNRANQRYQQQLAAEQAKREEEAKDAYRALGRATGVDVDAMERRIAEQERAAASSTPGAAPAR